MRKLLIPLLLISGIAGATEGYHKFQRAVWVTHPNGDEMVCLPAGQKGLLACALQTRIKDANWFRGVAGVEARSEVIICEPGIQ